MIRGWCPTVHAPMPSGDGLLARVKPFGGRLSAAALQALAEAAAACGNGVVELTARGNLQVRGLHRPAAFARAMVAAGLADADPVREARRNVVAVPPCDDAVVAAVEARLSDMAGLPAKFVAVVQGERVWEGAAAAAALQSLRAPGSRCRCDPQRGKFGHLLYLPFGQTEAADLAWLAAQVPEVRTTPWRALLSPVPVAGFATAPDSVTACIGAPGCASASTATRADAMRLAARGFAAVHVSGCAKRCAHPGTSTTLLGRDGRYDLERTGRPAVTGLTLDQAAALL